MKMTSLSWKGFVFLFIARLIRHIPESNFKTIRYYGFYSSKGHPLLEFARRIIDKTKATFKRAQNRWRELMIHSFQKDPLQCSCGTIMKWSYDVPRLE